VAIRPQIWQTAPASKKGRPFGPAPVSGHAGVSHGLAVVARTLRVTAEGGLGLAGVVLRLAVHYANVGADQPAGSVNLPPAVRQVGSGRAARQRQYDHQSFHARSSCSRTYTEPAGALAIT